MGRIGPARVGRRVSRRRSTESASLCDVTRVCAAQRRPRDRPCRAQPPDGRATSRSRRPRRHLPWLDAWLGSWDTQHWLQLTTRRDRCLQLTVAARSPPKTMCRDGGACQCRLRVTRRGKGNET
eukprot:1784971-Prymnesium_polylepis.2